MHELLISKSLSDWLDEYGMSIFLKGYYQLFWLYGHNLDLFNSKREVVFSVTLVS